MTSYVTVACLSANRWFDLDAERGPGSPNTHARTAKGVTSRPNDCKTSPDGNRATLDIIGETNGAPPLDCWFDTDQPAPLDEEPPVSEARYLVGDVFQRMAEIPDHSVDLIVTSPPFLALRSYLPSNHPQKHLEIGSEPTPAAFLSTLLALTREWRRVLAPHGSIAVELGDTYSGSGGVPSDAGKTYHNRNNDIFDGGQYVIRTRGDTTPGGAGWPLAKSVCLIPTLYPASLAYGRNLLDPDDLIEPWRIRNLIVWHRPNPPVGALGDKVRPATSYITTACTRTDRWFDLDAERTPYQASTLAVHGSGTKYTDDGKSSSYGTGNWQKETRLTHDGAPLLDAWIDDTGPDVWTIPTQPYNGAHYATFPITLPRRLINLMCPRQVCTVCGEPRRRITQSTRLVNGKEVKGGDWSDHGGNGWKQDRDPSNGQNTQTIVDTLGWTECDCPWTATGPNWRPPGHNYRRGIVLDPFCGSGTTLAAASELGRDSIGIDLDPRNLELARERCGMFLIEEPAA